MSTENLAAILRVPPKRLAGPGRRAEANLTIQEAAALSYVDGSLTAKEIGREMRLDEEAIASLLGHLEELTMIEWVGALPARLKSSGEDRLRRAIPTDPEFEAALLEECDLDRETKVRILVIERDIEKRSYWDLLGLRGDPSPAEVKRSYFAISKQFHPDRFFGKELGSYKARLERIFHGLNEASEVLTDPVKHGEYRLKHPPPAATRSDVRDLKDSRKARFDRFKMGSRPVESESDVDDPDRLLSEDERRDKKARLEEHRALIIERRKKRFKPVGAQEAKARKMYEQGLQQLADNDLMSAARSFKLAASYAPKQQAYREKFEQIQDAALEQRVRQLFEQAKKEQDEGQFVLAAETFAKVAEMLPERGTYALRAAKAFQGVSDTGNALRYAERAAELMPRNKEAQMMVAQLFEESGNKKKADKHRELARSLDDEPARDKNVESP